MNLTLSSADRSRIGAAVRVLLSPLAHPGVDAWRSAVNRSLKELLGADIGTFVLPVEGACAVYTEDIDAQAAGAYTDREPELPGGSTMWQRQAEVPVWNRAVLYGEHTPAYYRSDYYNDFVVPLRGYDAIGATLPLNGEPGPTSLATILFHHERPNGPRFGGRGLELLRLCFPAFEAGTRTYLRLRDQVAILTRTLDATGGALLLLDLEGRELHRTPAMCRSLDEDPELGRSGEIARLTEALGLVGRGKAMPGLVLERRTALAVRTRAGSYRVSGSFLGADSEPEAILVTLERLMPAPVSGNELRERFGLTGQEVRVARLLAEGRSNNEIAKALFISPHTARHHTERVLGKLGVHSRAAVGRIILQGTPEPLQ